MYQQHRLLFKKVFCPSYLVLKLFSYSLAQNITFKFKIESKKSFSFFRKSKLSLVKNIYVEYYFKLEFICLLGMKAWGSNTPINARHTRIYCAGLGCNGNRRIKIEIQRLTDWTLEEPLCTQPEDKCPLTYIEMAVGSGQNKMTEYTVDHTNVHLQRRQNEDD